MIRIDALWLCTRPQNMCADAERLLNVVVTTVGCARAHHGYLFANARAGRIKLLVWSVPDGDALCAPGRRWRPVWAAHRFTVSNRVAPRHCPLWRILAGAHLKGQGSLRVPRSDRNLQIRVL